MQSSKGYMRNNFYNKDTVNGNIKIKFKCNNYVKIKYFHFTFESSNCGFSSLYIHMELGLYFPDGM